MRRKKARNGNFLILCIIVGLVILVNRNTTASTETDYYVTTANLNVRTGAGTRHSILFTLQKGIEVEVIAKKNNWYRIRHLEQAGYVYSRYLKHNRTEFNTTNVQFETSEIQSNTTLRPFQVISYIITGVFAFMILFFGFKIIRKLRNRKLLKTVTSPKRGTQSERDLVLKLLKCGASAEMIFHDLYLQKPDDDFSQIDLVMLTNVGIIVFEVKDYSGWIFGTGYEQNWTQSLAYGKLKYSFYNPIKQNNNHIEVLRKKLRHFGDVPYYSVVVFYGNCVLKDIIFVPDGTLVVKSERILKALKIILKNNELIQYTNVNEVIKVLKEAAQNGESTKIKNQHSENINNMLGKHRVFK